MIQFRTAMIVWQTRFIFAVLILGVATFSPALWAPLVWAQDSQTSTTSGGSSSLRIRNIRLAPFTRPRPGRLVAIRAQVINTGTEPQSARVVTKIGSLPDRQSGFEVTIPGGDSRVLQMHLPIPSEIIDERTLDISVALMRSDSEQDIILIDEKGQPIIDSYSTNVDLEKVTTAACFDAPPPDIAEWQWPAPPDHFTYEMVVATRLESQCTRRLLLLDQEFLPCQMADWDAIDTFVIGGGNILKDAASVESIRRWMSGGGRVWVMLDKIDPADLKPLMPDGFVCEMIDDCLLSDFVVDVQTTPPTTEQDRTVSLEEPVSMRRVLQSGGQVLHTVNGYPSSIVVRAGQGRLYISTLDARAWIKPRKVRRSTTDERLNSNHELHSWAIPFTSDFMNIERGTSPLDARTPDYAMKHIGQQVLSRSTVMACLIGFMGALIAVAGLCWRIGKVTWYGWIAPLVALGSAVPLLVASSNYRAEVPTTSARLQIIQAFPGSSTLTVNEWMATYLGDADGGRLEVDSDIKVDWPKQASMTDIRRWSWKDLQKAQITSSGWPSGHWQMELGYELPPQDLTALARLSEQGLSIELPSSLKEPLEDAILVYAPGDVGIAGTILPGSEAKFTESSPIASNSWISGSLVNDEQNRRDEVYALLNARGRGPRFPSYPALIGWTGLWEGRPKWSTPRQEPGAALVVLPIRLERPQANSVINIPHWVVTANSLLVNGSTSTSFYNERGRWGEATTIASRVALRFSLPSQIQAFETSEITLDLKVRAPQRTVTISSREGDQFIELAKLDSPLGEIKIPVKQPEVLRLLNDGKFDTWIEVSNRHGQKSGQSTADIGNWQIDYFHLSTTGRVLAQ